MENQSSCCLPSCERGNFSQSASSLADETDIVRELNELSFVEREKVMDDVHGVSKVQEETPEFVEECLKEMDEMLDAIPARKKREYSRALFLWPGLKSDTKFKLRFLRADFYDGMKAAKRMVRYYEEKRSIFGEAKLVKTITIDDLNECDLGEFTTGCTVLLPIRDQSGRPIVYYDDSPADNWDPPIENTIRALWYHQMAVFDDETAQIKGAVGVNRICASPGNLLNPTWIRKQLDLNARIGDILDSAIPGRYSSLHVCIDSPSIGILASSLRLAMGKSTRHRIRIHMGSDVENEYSLMTFGMPFEGVLQKTRGGSNAMHLNYIQRRREIDGKKVEHEFQECVRTGFVAAPIQSDVLFGRGKPYRDFPGNKAWNRLIEDNYDRYRLGNSRFEKTCVTVELVKSARKCSDFRFFLESTDGGWKMIRDDAYLREKASMALKNRAKSLSRMESREMVDGNIAKRRRYESSDVVKGDGSEHPFEPLLLN